jgi:hypothetical protein
MRQQLYWVMGTGEMIEGLTLGEVLNGIVLALIKGDSP